MKYQVAVDSIYGQGEVLLHPVAKPRYTHICRDEDCCSFVGHVGISDYWASHHGLIVRHRHETNLNTNARTIPWDSEGMTVSEGEAIAIEFALAIAGIEGWL